MTIGQEFSETKCLGNIKGEEKTFSKGDSEKDFGINVKCTVFNLL